MSEHWVHAAQQGPGLPHRRSMRAQVPTGAWFPLALTAAVMAISLTWHSVYIMRQAYHRAHSSQLGALLQPLPPDAPQQGPSQYRVRCRAPIPGCTVLRMARQMCVACTCGCAPDPRTSHPAQAELLPGCRLDGCAT